MTKIAPAKQIIYAALTAGWIGDVDTTLTLDNDDFDPPAKTLWGRGVVRHLGSSQETLGDTGNRKFERSGSLIVQLFAPLDKGTIPSDNQAEIVQGLFEGKTLVSGGDQVIFTDAVIREIGPTEDGYQTNVEAFFTYHETK